MTAQLLKRNVGHFDESPRQCSHLSSVEWAVYTFMRQDFSTFIYN